MDVESVYLGIVLAQHKVPDGGDHTQLRDGKVRTIIDAIKRKQYGLAAQCLLADLGVDVANGKAADGVVAKVHGECEGRALQAKIAALKRNDFTNEAELRAWAKDFFGLVEPAVQLDLE